MRRTKFKKGRKGKVRPVEGSFFMVDKRLVYDHGMEVALYMANLFEKHVYFQKHFPQYEGRFFPDIRHTMQAAKNYRTSSAQVENVCKNAGVVGHKIKRQTSQRMV